jgi:hypothetical protein
VAFEIVRVLVSLAVPELGHQARRRIPEMQRDRVGARLGQIVLKLAEAALE